MFPFIPRERKTFWKVQKIMSTPLKALKSNLWQNIVEETRNKPTLQPLYWSRQKQEFWVLVPFVFLLHFDPTYSHLLTAHYCRHLLVHYHLRCLIVCFCFMKPWLLSYTLRLFLWPPNPSLSKASIARQHYQYMWFLLVE